MMIHKTIVVLIMSLFANIALAAELPIGITQAKLPIYAPNNPDLSLWTVGESGMEGSSSSNFLYSDGAYCHSLGAVGGVILLNGQWQFNKDKTGIDITLYTNDKPFYIINDESFDEYQQDLNNRQRRLKLPDLFFYKKQVYLGFSNQEIPTQMALFDYNKHHDEIIIPNNSKYLFVAENQDSKKTIAHFDLNAFKHPNITLLYNDGLMGVSRQEINEYFLDNQLTFIIKNGKVGLKDSYSDDVDFFQNSYHIDLNTVKNDDMNFKRLHRYCLGQSDEFYFDVFENRQSNLTKPTYINWHGKINPTADWLKMQD